MKVGIFNVRLVYPGMQYGRNNALTNDKYFTYVEFYDSRQSPAKFGELGQFVSRYYMQTIMQTNGGIILDTGSIDWVLSSVEVEEVKSLISKL